jgi:hypothetical protein
MRIEEASAEVARGISCWPGWRTKSLRAVSPQLIEAAQSGTQKMPACIDARDQERATSLAPFDDFSAHKAARPGPGRRTMLTTQMRRARAAGAVAQPRTARGAAVGLRAPSNLRRHEGQAHPCGARPSLRARKRSRKAARVLVDGLRVVDRLAGRIRDRSPASPTTAAGSPRSPCSAARRARPTRRPREQFLSAFAHPLRCTTARAGRGTLCRRRMRSGEDDRAVDVTPPDEQIRRPSSGSQKRGPRADRGEQAVVELSRSPPRPAAPSRGPRRAVP